MAQETTLILLKPDCVANGINGTVIKRFEESEHTTIEKIVITGSGALLNGLDAYMHDMFSHTIVIANPFAKVAYPAFLEDTLTQGGPVFSGAVGVALRALQNGQ